MKYCFNVCNIHEVEIEVHKEQYYLLLIKEECVQYLIIFLISNTVNIYPALSLDKYLCIGGGP